MVSSNPVPFAPERLRGLLAQFAHRGPDDQGWLSLQRDGSVERGRDAGVPLCPRALLLHRRLSILDLTECGWQPMSTPDGRFHLVYNGEIYNFVELQRELQGLGHAFRSHSDTEVLLAALAQWGVDALHRLVGMFAFALLDVRERTLLLARDPFGIKPLYYAASPGGLAFASEVRTLLELSGLPRRATAQGVYDYLRFALSEHGEGTMYEKLRQLPAAHYVRMGLDDAHPGEPARYWSAPLHTRRDLSFKAAAEALRELMLESVRLHLRSDVRVGAALSGGVDSSALVAAVHHLQPSAELHTFTYVADHEPVSDEKWADVIIAGGRVRAHKVRPSSGEMVRDLDELIRVQEEPFASTAIYAQNRVFRLAAEAGIKVTLDGQGADEIFAGYGAFRSARLASLLRQGAWREMARFARASSEFPGYGGRRFLLRAGGLLIPQLLQEAALHAVGQPLVPDWMNAGWFQERGVRFRTPWRGVGREVLKERMHRFLTEIHLPALLRYGDRNSMAYSLESRVPFLTPQIVEFAYSLPEEYHVARDGTTKAVLKEAMRGLVPGVILDRRDKIGFATPERQWLRALKPWVEEVLRSDTARRIPVFKKDLLHREWERVLDGRAAFDSRIWRWVNLIRWAELHQVTFD
jgi:asparagine synthase (glutamine-hydrolysing)